VLNKFFFCNCAKHTPFRQKIAVFFPLCRILFFAKSIGALQEFDNHCLRRPAFRRSRL
jgi:hypothetical protein